MAYAQIDPFPKVPHSEPTYDCIADQLRALGYTSIAGGIRTSADIKKFVHMASRALDAKHLDLAALRTLDAIYTLISPGKMTAASAALAIDATIKHYRDSASIPDTEDSFLPEAQCVLRQLCTDKPPRWLIKLMIDHMATPN